MLTYLNLQYQYQIDLSLHVGENRVSPNSAEMAESQRSKITNITQLPKDLLFECCHWLGEEDIYSLANVSKEMSSIAMHPIALSETILNYGGIQSKINNPRYSMIKGLYIHEQESIQLPEQLAQRLRVIEVDLDEESKIEFECEFQNLDTINSFGDPTKIFQKISKSSYSKLKHLTINDAVMTIDMFKWIFKFENLESLSLKLSGAPELNDAQFVTEFDHIINACTAAFQHLKHFGLDGVSIVKFRPFFHYIIASSPISDLKVYSNIRNQTYEPADMIAVFGVQFDESKFEHMASHLKQIYVYHSSNPTPIKVLQRLASRISGSDGCFELDSFQIFSHMFRDSLSSPMNSINIYDSFDKVIANTARSRLKLRCNQGAKALRALVQQFDKRRNQNKRCFTRLDIAGEFCPSVSVYGRWSEFADEGGADIDISCKELLDELWYDWALSDWIRLCNPASVTNFSGFGINQFVLEIKLHSNIEFLSELKSSGYDEWHEATQWLADFDVKYQSKLANRMAQYQNTRLQWQIYEDDEEVVSFRLCARFN